MEGCYRVLVLKLAAQNVEVFLGLFSADFDRENWGVPRLTELDFVEWRTPYRCSIPGCYLTVQVHRKGGSVIHIAKSTDFSIQRVLLSHRKSATHRPPPPRTRTVAKRTLREPRSSSSRRSSAPLHLLIHSYSHVSTASPLSRLRAVRASH